MLKIDSYRNNNNISYIKYVVDKFAHRDIEEIAGVIAASSGLPLVVVYTFIGEYKGFSEQIMDRIEGLNNFYGYTNE